MPTPRTILKGAESNTHRGIAAQLALGLLKTAVPRYSEGKMTYAQFMAALCVWREARGEESAAQAGVAWSIINRTSKSAWWNGNKGGDYVAVVMFPAQYSSMTILKDPNTIKFPASNDPVWPAICNLFTNTPQDPTGGATSYYSTDIPEPSWAAEMTFTVQIGAFRFFK